MNSLYNMMVNHQSIRKYKNEPVKEEDLRTILDAAIHCPTSINGQQFSIIVIKDQKKKDLIAEWTGGQSWIANAPVFLLFVSDFFRVGKAMSESGTSFDNIESVEATMVGSVDCGIAFGNAMNMAENLGYGIVPIGAVRRQPDQIIDLLKLPQYVYPVLGMCIGVPDENPGLKPRFPYEAMIHEEIYHQDVDDLLKQYDQTVRDYMNQRTGGKDIRSWSDGVTKVYQNVYFPLVNPTLKKQGYTNEK